LASKKKGERVMKGQHVELASKKKEEKEKS
jgi:hypothetical protein